MPDVTRKQSAAEEPRDMTEMTLDQLWESFASDVDAIGWRQGAAFWRHIIEQKVRAEARLRSVSLDGRATPTRRRHE